MTNGQSLTVPLFQLLNRQPAAVTPASKIAIEYNQ